jgi:predicted SAM-dependent methyltransferase
MLLNLGCGAVHAEAPWVNIDNWAGAEPDVCCNISELPYEDHSVEAVYMGHVLEHLDYYLDVPAVLAEVSRVLSDYGQVCIVGPDSDKVRDPTQPDWHQWTDMVDHGDGTGHPGSEHLWRPTVGDHLKAVWQFFPDAREVNVLTLSGFWPIASRIGWQFAILGRDL